MNRNSKSAVLLSALALALSALSAAYPRAQERGMPITLRGAQYNVSRLGPDRLSGEAVFPLDRCGSVRVETIATAGNLDVSIVGPAGQTIDANTVGAMGGAFTSYEGVEQPAGPPLLAAHERGFHYVFTFPWPGEGDYTVRFKAPAGLAEDVGLLTEVTTDSRIAAALFVPEPTLPLGTPLMLTAAVFDGPAPIAGAEVKVTVGADSGSKAELTLRDDGLAGDASAGDGLYSAEYVPGKAGEHLASARIKGTTPGGVNFTRHSATSFNVVEPGGSLTRAVQDQGVDTNRDGLFEHIALDVEVNIRKPARYRAFVQLKTAGGRTLVRSGAATLPAGTHNIRVKFEAADLIKLGENGPYEVKLIDLVMLGEKGASPSGRVADVHQTRAYLLSQHQRPALALTGLITDQGADDNNNGLYDRLLVSVQVYAVRAGTYTWSFKLADRSSREIELVSGRSTFAAGLNNLQVSFSGLRIGNSGADGPYLLRDLLLFGPSSSLVVAEIGKTKPYLPWQFEGANRPPVANAGPDQTIECASASANPVRLDGSASHDPDGNPLAFEWRDAAGNVVGSAAVVTLSLPLGSHTFTLAVNDGRGGLVKDSVLVVVGDTKPPELQLSLSPSVLWPPNGKLIPVAATLQASDLCDPGPTVELVSITSSEPDAGPVEGGPDGDIQGSVFGTDDREFLLRAKRLGTGPGRVYSVTYRARDAAGNASSVTAQVNVPHDQGREPQNLPQRE